LKEVQGVLKFKSSVSSAASALFEDNQGAVTLANAPKMTPRYKHIAIPYHYFCEEVKKKEVEVKHISTDKQLADLLTKGLVEAKFEGLRDRLMGWCEDNEEY